ncbi:response regulator [Novosphingobium sp.]|uniref:response regulator n=1 Tax=Novosphingobium sp. TaxID=1874826 RepID=UPI003B52B45D
MPLPSGSATIEQQRIIIVEDDAVLAEYFAELLIGMGHDVCAIAGTEAEAVAEAEAFHPDLMIVDGQLREGSGVSAMARILRKGDVAHFYVTGNPWSLREQVPDAVIVTKPFTLRELNHAIAVAVESERQRQSAV